MTSSVAVGTIAAKNYLSYARVLERSLRKQHPELPLFVLLADEPEGCFDPAAEAFKVLDLDDIGISNLQTVKFQYSRAQLAIAAKPYLLLHLLEAGFDRVVFLDPDILVTGDLTPLLAPEFASSIMLTPHVLSPLSGADRFSRELNVIRSGVFNGGFIGVSNTEIARRFLQWWSDRVRQHCLHDLPRGIHFDQRWIDLAPGFFDDIAIVRDPACNVAYWNLQERNARAIGDRATVDGRPCRFFHFSGFRPDHPKVVTKYSDLRVADMGSIASLFEQYGAMLEAADYNKTKCWPYAYDRFENGAAIPHIARELFLELGESTAVFGDPFTTGPGSYFAWLNESDGATGITHLWEAVYRRRRDLQIAFPDHRGAQRAQFLHWTVTSGSHEHGIAECFWPHLARAGRSQSRA